MATPSIKETLHPKLQPYVYHGDSLAGHLSAETRDSIARCIVDYAKPQSTSELVHYGWFRIKNIAFAIIGISSWQTMLNEVTTEAQQAKKGDLRLQLQSKNVFLSEDALSELCYKFERECLTIFFLQAIEIQGGQRESIDHSAITEYSDKFSEQLLQKA